MSKKNFSVSRLILLICNIVLALCLILSYLAEYISPESVGFIAFFGLAYPILFFLNFVFVVLWIILLNKYFFISLVAILIHWGNFPIGMSLMQSKSITKEKNDIKIFTYNAHGFNSLWKNSETGERNRTYIVDLLGEEKPDIICFQEFFSHKKRYNILDTLQLKCDYPFVSYTPSAANSVGGVMIFSKYPIVNFERQHFDNSGNLYMVADIAVNKDTLRVFNIHLESIKFTEREKEFYNQMSNVDHDSLSKGGHTLYYKLNKAFKERAKQAELISDLIGQSPYPVIVCGDFNDTPSSYTYHLISKNLKDTFKEKGTGTGATYNGKMPAFRIDYILHSPLFAARSHEIRKAEFSDHYPVISILQKKPTEEK